jgi:thymidylate kinase
MLKIDAKDLENVLFAVEDVVQEGKYSEEIFQTLLKDLQKKNKKTFGTFLQKVTEVTKVLLKQPSRDKLGYFLVITGVDKSGKETQAFNNERRPEILSIYDYLTSRSFEVLRLALPSYQTIFGSLVASYLGKENSQVEIVGNISKEIAWVLWSLDRAQHNPEIEKWLQNNQKNVVLSKRWTETNIAYQKPQGIDERRILHFERNLTKADCTIVLDVPIEEVFVRMKDSGEIPDKYETRDFLSKVSHFYKTIETIYPIGKIVHIDGSGSIEEVNRKLIEVVGDIKLDKSMQTISQRFC